MQKKVTLLFPGQGSQYVGMGKDLAGALSNYEAASELLKFDIKSKILFGSEDDLKSTEITQPAIFAYSAALFDSLRIILSKRNISIDLVLGHSVGEYGALFAAGVLSFNDCVMALFNRGRFMQEAMPQHVGAMYAIMRADEELVLRATEHSSLDNSIVSVANYNSKDQLVISGHREACERAVKFIEEFGGPRVRSMELKVSAPFHSKLMVGAESKMKEYLKEIEFNNLEADYIANVDAKRYKALSDGSIVRDNLVRQISAPVQWIKSIEQLENNALAIEVGPGHVLQGLVAKIRTDIQVISLDRPNAFSLLEEQLFN